MSQPRKVLLVSHAGRKSNIETAALATKLLRDADISVRVVVPKNDGAIAAHPVLSRYELVSHCGDAVVGVDFVLVMGGDGTFLRAADLAYMADLPMLGINLGHIGFLAEWERDSLDEAVKRVVSGEFSIEERMTVAVQGIGRNGESLGSGWALNEVSVENQNRSGVLDAILKVDGRPYHTTTKDFNPTRVFAETTTLTATDVARDVHFDTWFGKGEIAGTQAELRDRKSVV